MENDFIEEYENAQASALKSISEAIDYVKINIESTYRNEDIKEAAEAILILSQAYKNINS